jgi:hypothetical protein
VEHSNLRVIRKALDRFPQEIDSLLTPLRCKQFLTPLDRRSEFLLLFSASDPHFNLSDEERSCQIFDRGVTLTLENRASRNSDAFLDNA